MKEVTVEIVIEILNENIENAEVTEDKFVVELSELGMDSITFSKQLSLRKKNLNAKFPILNCWLVKSAQLISFFMF